MKYFVTKNASKGQHLLNKGFTLEGKNIDGDRTYYQFLDTKELRNEVKKYIKERI